MHIMPSDANCIPTTNIVNNTDSINYEKMDVTFLWSDWIDSVVDLNSPKITLFEWQVIWKVNKRNDKALESQYPGYVLCIRTTMLRLDVSREKIRYK